MKKLSKNMMIFIVIIILAIGGLSLYLINTPKEMTRIEELKVEKENIESDSEESTIPVSVEKTPQEILDEEEAVYQELADTSLQVYVYMEQLGELIVEYHSLYAMDDPKGALEESTKINDTIKNIKYIVDDLDYLPETAIYLESKRLTIEVINKYYEVALAVMDKKTYLDFPGTREAYSQSESVDILMAQLVTKLDEEKITFQKEHGLKK